MLLSIAIPAIAMIDEMLNRVMILALSFIDNGCLKERATKHPTQHNETPPMPEKRFSPLKCL